MHRLNRRYRKPSLRRILIGTSLIAETVLGNRQQKKKKKISIFPNELHESFRLSFNSIDTYLPLISETRIAGIRCIEADPLYRITLINLYTRENRILLYYNLLSFEFITMHEYSILILISLILNLFYLGFFCIVYLDVFPWNSIQNRYVEFRHKNNNHR